MLKPYAEPLLALVQPQEATYAKAHELHTLLSFVNGASSSIVPTTSLLREFIGEGAWGLH